MNRRTLLAGTGSAVALLGAGCLSGDPESSDDENGESTDTDHCVRPDAGANTVAYEETAVVDEPGWLETEAPPAAEPHLVLLRSATDAEELVDLERLAEEERAFLETTDYDESSLVVAEHWLTHGFSLTVEGVERPDDETVVVYLCETDRREDGQEYPAVDHHHSVVIRVTDDDRPAPERAAGVFVGATPDADPVEIGEDESERDDGTDEPEPLEPPRDLVVENLHDEPHTVEVVVTRDGEELVDDEYTVEPGSTVELEAVAEYSGEYEIVVRRDDVAERYRWTVYDEVFDAFVTIEPDGELWISEDVA
ncbi:hypothetical protein [Natronobeatus ordinarius]|uniref:hypothetical protein n=1 Tax=Natronobeatus ordinarius TaxID=2963433 RepID=UPI0020CD19F2|nr:hypothetical protein [Natronobeatus ordinarius]